MIFRRPESSRGTRIGFFLAAVTWLAFVAWFTARP